MLDLSAPKASFDIVLPYNLNVTVKPLTTAGMAAAQAAARRAVEAIERQAPRQALSRRCALTQIDATES